jgi:hypothetical protein
MHRGNISYYFGGDNFMREGGASLMDTLSYVAIGILVVAIIFMLVPVIGGTMDSSMPALGATSKWNATYNTALKTGSDFWQTLSPFILIAALAGVAMIVVYIVRGQ